MSGGAPRAPAPPAVSRDKTLQSLPQNVITARVLSDVATNIIHHRRHQYSTQKEVSQGALTRDNKHLGPCQLPTRTAKVKRFPI